MCGSEKGLASPCGRGVGKAFRDADDVHGLTWEEEESASGKEQYASAGYSAKLIMGVTTEYTRKVNSDFFGKHTMGQLRTRPLACGLPEKWVVFYNFY